MQEKVESLDQRKKKERERERERLEDVKSNL